MTITVIVAVEQVIEAPTGKSTSHLVSVLKAY